MATTIPPTTIAPTTIMPTLAPTTPPPWDPLKGTKVDCSGDYPVFDFDISGICANTWVDNDILEFNLSIDGDANVGNTIVSDLPEFDFGFYIGSGDDHSAYVHVNLNETSFVIWSKIGSFDFTIDHTNEAGRSYLRDIGTIYGIRKLINKVIVYGSSGICSLTASELAWGYKLLSKVGVMGRDSHVGNEDAHWYIDEEGDLFELSDKMKRIGYKEFLSNLSYPVMSLDEKRRCIYICDESYGYVFSYVDYSLGEGSPSITGFGYGGSRELVLAPGTVAPLTISFITDVIDMDSRKEKTILSVEVSTDLDEDMEVAIDYGNTLEDEFSSTPWVKLNPHGVAYVPCYGVDFRIKVRVADSAYTELKIDKLTINGVIHGVSYRDF